MLNYRQCWLGPGGEGGTEAAAARSQSPESPRPEQEVPSSCEHPEHYNHHYPQTGKNSDKNANNLQEQVPRPQQSAAARVQ